MKDLQKNKDPQLAYYNGLKLLSTIVKIMPKWLSEESAILTQLDECWDSEERADRLLNGIQTRFRQ